MFIKRILFSNSLQPKIARHITNVYTAHSMNTRRSCQTRLQFGNADKARKL